MKRKIVTLLTALSLTFALTGCGGNTVINEAGKEVPKIGNFIEISHVQDGTDFFRIVYDEDTKLVYYYVESGYRGALCPYWITDENGNQKIRVYEGE